jgi:hypothetical protein
LEDLQEERKKGNGGILRKIDRKIVGKVKAKVRNSTSPKKNQEITLKPMTVSK